MYILCIISFHHLLLQHSLPLLICLYLLYFRCSPQVHLSPFSSNIFPFPLPHILPPKNSFFIFSVLFCSAVLFSPHLASAVLFSLLLLSAVLFSPLLVAGVPCSCLSFLTMLCCALPTSFYLSLLLYPYFFRLSSDKHPCVWRRDGEVRKARQESSGSGCRCAHHAGTISLSSAPLCFSHLLCPATLRHRLDLISYDLLSSYYDSSSVVSSSVILDYSILHHLMTFYPLLHLIISYYLILSVPILRYNRWYHIILYYIKLFNVKWYDNMLYCIVLYYVLLHYIILHHILEYHTTLCYSILCYIIICYSLLFYIILNYIISYYIILHIILYYTILYYIT